VSGAADPQRPCGKVGRVERDVVRQGDGRRPKERGLLGEERRVRPCRERGDAVAGTERGEDADGLPADRPARPEECDAHGGPRLGARHARSVRVAVT
jgi:hypothetical protein